MSRHVQVSHSHLLMSSCIIRPTESRYWQFD